MDDTNDIVIASWYITEISAVILALAVFGTVDLSQTISIGILDISTYEQLIKVVAGAGGVISLGDKLTQ